MIHMGVARKWHFSTLGGPANLGGVSGDLFEYRGSGIPLLGIASSLFYAQIDWTIMCRWPIILTSTINIAPLLIPNPSILCYCPRFIPELDQLQL